VDPHQPDDQSDRNFDYDQPVEPQGGVPRSDWIVEEPFDSAEWLDKEEPKYEDDAEQPAAGQ
jgi:hypothetical protein